MSQLLQAGWSWYPSVLAGFALLTLLYILAIRSGEPQPAYKQIAFHTGTLLGLLALVSPLDALGDEYLFSAHMIQHLLLMFGTAPLWLVGLPGGVVDRVLPRQLEKWASKLVSPLPAYLIFVGVMGVWHVPAAFQAAQGSEGIHIIEHLTFIGAAILGWWPAIGPGTSRLRPPEAPIRMLYLFLLAFPCTALAALLTYTKTPLYPFYVTAPHIFGLDVMQDQRLGGLLMWLPTHMILLLAMGITFFKWFLDSSQRADQDLMQTVP